MPRRSDGTASAPTLPTGSWPPIAAVALLAAAVHAGALRNGFAYDDVTLILGDARIHSLRNAGRFLTSGYWADPELALFRPLTSLSFALNFALAGPAAHWFHATNIVLHVIVSVLVLALLGRLLPPAAALAGAAVFAVHPVHVEAVANVAGRAELLAATFALAACVVWARRHDSVAREGAARRVVPALFLLGLLAKESVVMLPALLVLLDAACRSLRRTELTSYAKRNMHCAVGMLAAAGAYLMLRYNALGALVPARVDPVLAVGASAVDRTLSALQAWPHFARLLLAPVTLLADYGPGIIRPATTVAPTVFAGAVILTASTALGAVLLARGHTVPALAPLWFVVAVVPVSSLVLPIGVLVAERTLYLPSVAVAVAVGAAVAAALRGGARATRVAAVAVALLILAGSARSAVRVPEWRSTESIFAALLRDRPDNFRAQWIEARRLRAYGDVPAALDAYNRAVTIWPYAPLLGREAVAFAVDANALPQARALAARTVEARPADLDLHRMLAGIALDLADSATARTAVMRGLAIDPDDDILRRMRAALDRPEES